MADEHIEAADAKELDPAKKAAAKARREMADLRIRMKLADEAMKAALAERKALKVRQTELAGDKAKPAKTPKKERRGKKGDESADPHAG